MTAEFSALDHLHMAQALRLARRKSRLACRLHAETQWSHEVMLDRYDALLRQVAEAGA